ncbi:MurR/RpiR family transcriptional regulator [Mediterraneibacter agrestimuris]|uniref:MurR/RpiR family transcriptional regulator n=1 Tax=Mediterraneibacter agrestimuris TaxID=2941333 RepID=UPI0020411239|nr:MurR/RpiR family transcriptional regulator [Mediterraneibacter agrestimuris]
MAIEDLVRANYRKLNENDLHIWKYIDNHREECCRCTIEELAKNCNVSRTTILRFAKKLSMDGFSELKIHMKMERNKKSIPIRNITKLVCDDYRKRIDEMEKNEYTNICRCIYEAKRIFVYGSGAVQSFVAKEFKRAFLSAKICMNLIEGGKGERELIMDILQEGDLVIIVSLSGESNHVVEFAKSLRMKDVKIISMTKLKNNTLAQMRDENLYINTSTVGTSYIQNYETTTLFFMTVELLLIKYLIYQEKRCEELVF